MSETMEKFILVVAEISILIVACMFALGGIQSQDAAVNVTYKSAVNDERRLFTSLEITEQVNYTGAEVLQSIRQMKMLDANIRVVNKYFYRSDDIESIDVSGIDLNRTYVVSYIRDSQGKVQTIVFT
jgi:PBP1b-binding outer membrane lipoprotein LpoB